LGAPQPRDAIEDRMSEHSEKPRSEPEILPPERDVFGRGRPQPEFRGFHRVYVGRIGPGGLFASVIAAALIIAVLAFLVAGFLVFVLPALLAAAVISVAVVLLRGWLAGPRRR
jgi:hypothetical protein